MDDKDHLELIQRVSVLARRLDRLNTATLALQGGEVYIGDIPLPLEPKQKAAIKAAILARLTRIKAQADGLTSAIKLPGKPDPYQRAELETVPLKIVPLLTDVANNLAVRMQQFEPTEQPDGSDRYTLTPQEEQGVADQVVLLGPGVIALCALLRARVS